MGLDVAEADQRTYGPYRVLVGLILRQGQERVWNLRRQRQFHPRGLRSVYEHDLAPHLDRGVEDRPRDAHVLPDLERPWLDTNRFRIRWWIRETVDDPAADAMTLELGCHREANRAGSDN